MALKNIYLALWGLIAMRKADLLFLSLLRQDARQTLTAISKKTRIPISTLYDKLKHQEQEFIMKHTTIVNFTKLGYNCRAKIMFAAIKEDREKLRSFLSEHGSINSLFKINNGFDFMVEGIFQTVNELEDFVEMIESTFKISEKKIFYIIEDVKRESFLARPELVQNYTGG
jgi:DNA-binding Lrp family transcriptional regulator